MKMVKKSQNSSGTVVNPIIWALATVIVLVAAGYTYTIVNRCQPSSLEIVKYLKITMGACPADETNKSKDAISTKLKETKAIRVTREQLPCRWAWVYLGKFSPLTGEYPLGPSFRFEESKGPSSPFPKIGDSIILTQEKTLIISGYGTSSPEAKCNKILEPPWGYQPPTAHQYEAGKLSANTAVTVNLVKLMPNATAEPTYVWALVGPAQ